MPEWINVNDKLPELREEVLAYTSGGFMEVARLDFKYEKKDVSVYVGLNSFISCNPLDATA